MKTYLLIKEDAWTGKQTVLATEKSYRKAEEPYAEKRIISWFRQKMRVLKGEQTELYRFAIIESNQIEAYVFIVFEVESKINNLKTIQQCETTPTIPLWPPMDNRA